MAFKNIELNPGGLIGALVCGGVAAAFAFSNVGDAGSKRIPAKFIVVAVIAGAFAGNFLWGLVFKKR